MTNLRKWKKLTHVPRFPTFTAKPKSYGDKTQITAFRIIPEVQNKSGIQINIRMMRYDTIIKRTIRAFSG